MYALVLGNDFDKLKNNIDGIYTYKEIVHKDTGCVCNSPIRENFMLRIIEKEVNKSNQFNFISINGSFHTPLEKQKKWNNIENWESLTSLFKAKYPNRKVCSIYFMDREKDLTGTSHFPNERKLILDYFKPGKIYLIKLDSVNTPFKNLADKFQYIVIW